MQHIPNFQKISTHEDATIAFIAGCIKIQLKSSRINCTVCGLVFEDNENIEGPFLENGKTQRPCKSTFLICKTVHELIEEVKVNPEFNYVEIVNSA